MIVTMNCLPKVHNRHSESFQQTSDIIMSTSMIVQLIKSKEQKGFNMLYDKYSGVLYNTILKFVELPELADDLLQDTFVKIWKYIDHFEPTKGTLFTWMLRIAKNQSIDYLRSSSHQQQLKQVHIDLFLQHIEHSSNNDALLGEIEFKDFKIKALLKMNPKQAEVINMIFFYGWTHEQTAQILQIPLGTVKTRAKKGRALLKTMYQN
ncbi:MAG: RNA polymerase sigma factor [Saprospiraceae bacterium]|nr:RNA polymerase sigma factor [Saprospiraceae bacterium]